MFTKVYKYIIMLVLIYGFFESMYTQQKTILDNMNNEQLINYLRHIRNPNMQELVFHDVISDGKCGFGIQMQIATRWHQFTLAQRELIYSLIQPSPMQCNKIYGHFRIHFDTTGTNEPALINHYGQRISNSWKQYIDSVGRIMNEVWDIEIGKLGYEQPPLEVGEQYYNIYVKELNGGFYGQTVPIEPPINGNGNPKLYYTYIEIDNDYKEFKTKGIDGLKVTSAHEFHHAIQTGSYGYWEEDLYAYELTSTWMEDVIYPEIDDYLNYLPKYFFGFSDGLSFNTYVYLVYDGYERCIWAHYLAKRFGQEIMLDVWNNMRTKKFLESTENALLIYGSDLQKAFGEFTYWNFFTADRANTEKYYHEGDKYPRFASCKQVPFLNTTSTIRNSVEPLSSTMYDFGIGTDTVVVIVANVDVESAKLKDTTKQNIEIILSSQSISPPFFELRNGLKAKINVSSSALWTFYFSVGIDIADASPNPLRLVEAQKLLLPISDDQSTFADVYIYNSSFDLAYTDQIYTSYNEYSGKRTIELQTSKIKSSVSSGVYFIVAKTKSKQYLWKVAIIK